MSPFGVAVAAQAQKVGVSVTVMRFHHFICRRRFRNVRCSRCDNRLKFLACNCFVFASVIVAVCILPSIEVAVCKTVTVSAEGIVFSIVTVETALLMTVTYPNCDSVTVTTSPATVFVTVPKEDVSVFVTTLPELYRYTILVSVTIEECLMSNTIAHEMFIISIHGKCNIVVRVFRVLFSDFQLKCF